MNTSEETLNNEVLTENSHDDGAAELEIQSLREQLAKAEEAQLKANKALEASRKFEKFEDFRSETESKLKSVDEINSKLEGFVPKSEFDNVLSELSSIKEMLGSKNAESPNLSTYKQVDVPKYTADEIQLRKMMGLGTE